MDFYSNHLLSIITFFPALGALVLLLPVFRGKDDAVRWAANGIGLSSSLSRPPCHAVAP